MSEVAALGWVYVACALWLGSDHPRGVARWRRLQPIARARAARALAAALVLGAAVLWNANEPGPAAFLAVPVAIMACGTTITLLAAVFPRAIVVSALAALPLSAIGVTLG
jgi:hypothetical protein